MRKSFFFKYLDYSILLMPIAFVLGGPWVNFITISLSFFFLFLCAKFKFWKWVNYKWVIIYIIFIFYTIFISFIATDTFNSLRSSVSQFRYLFFCLMVSFFAFNYLSKEKIFKFWFVIISVIIFDLLIQFYYGKNLLGGYERTFRFAGIFGNELIIGSFLVGISCVVIGFSNSKLSKFFKDKFYLSGFLILLTFVGILVSGERMNFLLFMFFLFFLIIYKFKKKIFYLFFLFLILIFSTLFIINNNNSVKDRYLDFSKIILNFQDSSYGKLYNSGYQLWKQHKVFGVGLKNFRIKCDLEVVDNSKNTHPLCSTHPHNLYLEILSETGFVGLIIFLFFFIFLFKFVYNYSIKKKDRVNTYFISLLMLIIIYFWPLRTSGSFNTSWYGTFVWMHLGLLLNEFLKINLKRISF